MPSFSPESSETRSTKGRRVADPKQYLRKKSSDSLLTDMAEYANTHFETYLKEANLKQQILENPVPGNLDQVKKLDIFVPDILKGKQKQNDWGMDVIFEKNQ